MDMHIWTTILVYVGNDGNLSSMTSQGDLFLLQAKVQELKLKFKVHQLQSQVKAGSLAYLSRCMSEVDPTSFYKWMSLAEAKIYEKLSALDMSPEITFRFSCDKHQRVLLGTKKYSHTLHHLKATADYVEIKEKACSLLSRMHALGILHGDAHPGNFVCDDSQVKVIDFGASSQLSAITKENPPAGGIIPWEDKFQADPKQFDYYVFSQTSRTQ